MPIDLPAILVGGMLSVILLTIAITDQRRMVIPNWASASLLSLGAVNVAVTGTPSALDALLGAVCGAGVFAAIKFCYRLARDREGLGWGDVKFMAGAGSLVGLMLLPWLVLVAALSGLLMVVLKRSLDTHARLPFGPHLALGLMTCWLLRAVNWV
jgi:leader peptidase (prepilin peptidase) / N-methyltransferase